MGLPQNLWADSNGVSPTIRKTFSEFSFSIDVAFGVDARRIARLAPGDLMSHRIKDDVDSHGVSVDREQVEELVVLTLPLPTVRNIGVVGHDHHELAPVVANTAKMRLGGLETSL